LKLNGISDEIFRNLAQTLGVRIPRFTINRRLKFKVTQDEHKDWSELLVRNVDAEGYNVTAFKSFNIDINADKTSETGNIEEEPFSHRFKGKLSYLDCKFTFFGHHKEPPIHVGMKDWNELWEPLIHEKEVEIEYMFDLDQNQWFLQRRRVIRV